MTDEITPAKTTKTTPKQRATSAAKLAKTAARTPSAKVAPPARTTPAKLVFTPGVCHHRATVRGKIVLDCTEPISRKGSLLCKPHEAEWRKGAKLTAAGRSKFLAMAEERKLDPTLREKKAPKPKSAGTSKAVVGASKAKPAATAPKARTHPAQVKVIPAQIAGTICDPERALAHPKASKLEGMIAVADAMPA